MFKQGLAMATGWRVKRRHIEGAIGSVVDVLLNGYITGRGLLETAAAYPSYSHSLSEEDENGNRIDTRSDDWDFDLVMAALEPAGQQILSLFNGQPIPNLVSKKMKDPKQARGMVVGLMVTGLTFALAEEDLFGPF